MDYFDKIKERLASKLKGKELTKDSSFKDLGIDSLAVSYTHLTLPTTSRV